MDMWTTQERCPHAHSLNNKYKSQTISQGLNRPQILPRRPQHKALVGPLDQPDGLKATGESMVDLQLVDRQSAVSDQG
jgi:hypothetical protein